MSWYSIILYLHLVSGVLFVGYTLYWVIMAASLHRVKPGEEVTALLGVLAVSRWPHVAVPYRYRLPLPWLGMIFTGSLLFTGIALTPTHGVTGLLVIKVLLFVAIAGLQVLHLKDRREWIMGAAFALALATVALSALLNRA